VWLSDCGDAAKADTVQDVVPKADPEPAASTVRAATTIQPVAHALSPDSQVGPQVQPRGDCGGVVVTHKEFPRWLAQWRAPAPGASTRKCPKSYPCQIITACAFKLLKIRE
jgi:hypothetical protein